MQFYEYLIFYFSEKQAVLPGINVLKLVSLSLRDGANVTAVIYEFSQ